MRRYQKRARPDKLSDERGGKSRDRRRHWAPLEATSILHLPAGAYTAVVSGAAGGSGIGLLEVYDLD